MNDITTVRQNNQVITDLSPAYKAAGYTLPKAVTEASERVIAAAEFPSKVQQAQREAVAARDAAILDGDADAAITADLRAESAARLLTTGTLNETTGTALADHVAALSADYAAHGRDALVKAAQPVAEDFNDVYARLDGIDPIETIGKPDLAERMAELQRLGAELTVYRTAIDRMALRGHRATVAHPVTGEKTHPDIITAERLTRYMSGVGYPQPVQSIRQAAVDPHYGPAAPWVQMLRQQAVARPNQTLRLAFRSHEDQAQDMSELVSRWTAAQVAAGNSGYLMNSGYGWKLTKAEVEENTGFASSNREVAHSITA